MTRPQQRARYLPTVLGRAEVLDAFTIDGSERMESRSVDDAIAAVGRGDARAVVLALLLPGGSDAGEGLPLRLPGHPPPLVAWRRRSAGAEVDAGDLGLDEDVAFPRAIGELVARVRAMLPARGGVPAEPVVAHDGLRIDLASREATLDGSVVDLTRREFDLLAFLAASPRRAYSRDELLRHVWSSSDQWQDPATITEHVRRIRRKIERDPQHPRWITTVRSVGYRFEPVAAA